MPYETDERLKSYLDTNELRREQMCLATAQNDVIETGLPRGAPEKNGLNMAIRFSAAGLLCPRVPKMAETAAINALPEK